MSYKRLKRTLLKMQQLNGIITLQAIDRDNRVTPRVTETLMKVIKK
jgi:hypothetical protein